MNAELKLFEGLYDKKQSEPDTLNIESLNINNISLDYVLSRDKNGNIISKYSDNVWDFSPYATATTKSSKLFFEKINDKLLEKEAKQLVLLALLFSSGRNASSYSVNTIKNFYSNAILPITFFAKEKNTTIASILENNTVLTKYISNNCTTHGRIKNISVLLKLLVNIDNNISNIDFKEDTKLFNIIRGIDTKFRKREKQTLIIPTRIFHISLKARWEHIYTIEKNINNLTDFLEQYLNSSNFAIGNYHKTKTKNTKIVRWNEAVKEYKLKSLFEEYHITNRQSFKRFINTIQGTCKHLVHTYTGMRDGEALDLKTNCLEKPKDNYGAFKLVGITTKLEGKERTTKWITSKEIERVIIILSKVNTVVANIFNIELEMIPLFPSIGIMGNTKKNLQSDKYPIRRDKRELPLPEDDLILTVEDKKEIEEIDYMGKMDDLEIGQPWVFRSHQYRRSLAVYSILSGLVSLGALQIQLKHLFREMTMYYANGASYAKKLFDVPENHIGNDIDKLKPELDTLMYIKNVIFSDEELFGTHGTFVKRNLNTKQESFQTYLLENREKTIKQFKNGEIAYTENALGGCVSVKPCDYALTRSLVACMDCESSIKKLSKLDNVIKEQKELVEYLNKDSIEYRTEVRDLEELEKQRKILLRSKA